MALKLCVTNRKVLMVVQFSDRTWRKFSHLLSLALKILTVVHFGLCDPSYHG